jgi:hypothetical protein
MIDQLRIDRVARPDLLILGESARESVIGRALDDLGHPASPELRTLWGQAGYGDLFETEDLLGPVEDEPHDLVTHNRWRWDEGLSRDLLVFHTGLWVTTVDCDGRYVARDLTTLKPERELASLDGWYAALRDQYARKTASDRGFALAPSVGPLRRDTASEQCASIQPTLKGPPDSSLASR